MGLKAASQTGLFWKDGLMSAIKKKNGLNKSVSIRLIR